jgi:hypothetical protein
MISLAMTIGIFAAALVAVTVSLAAVPKFHDWRLAVLFALNFIIVFIPPIFIGRESRDIIILGFTAGLISSSKTILTLRRIGVIPVPASHSRSS